MTQSNTIPAELPASTDDDQLDVAPAPDATDASPAIVDSPATDAVLEDATIGTTSGVVTPADNSQVQGLYDMAHSTITLMGFSFILGSLFTILCLLLLDFMRRGTLEKK